MFPLSFCGQKLDYTFLVCPLPTKTDGLLGTDFLDRTGAKINFECGKLSLAANCMAPPSVYCHVRKPRSTHSIS